MFEAQEILKVAQEEGVSARLVLKDRLHLLILEHLLRCGLFRHLALQGGTALRLAFGGIRYSEDIDLVVLLGNPPPASLLEGCVGTLASWILRNLPMLDEARVIAQKKSEVLRRWRLVVRAAFLGGLDRTSIEVASVPAYDAVPRLLSRPGIPFTPAVRVESPAEILADKVVALGARSYLKGRDLWDLHHLTETLAVDPAVPRVWELVRRKLDDYGLDAVRWRERFRRRLAALPEEGPVRLKAEMDLFLPLRIREVFEPSYRGLCETLVRRLSGLPGS